MVVGEYWWLIYLVFLAIPLSRIIPRLLARDANKEYAKYGAGASAGSTAERGRKDSGPHDDYGQAPGGPARLPADHMSALGALHRGAKTFEGIQKKTGFDDDRLDRVLAELEEKRQIRVVAKKGLLGGRVEIHPTDSGFRGYYS